MKWYGYIAFSVASAIAGGSLVKKLWKEKYQKQKDELHIAQQEGNLLYRWLQLSQKGVELSDYFSANGYGSVAVFGMNREGRLAIEKLDDLAVYGVEAENLGAVHERLKVYRLGDDPLPPANCMVICDLGETPEKTALIQKAFSGMIISLEDVLTAIENEM